MTLEQFCELDGQSQFDLTIRDGVHVAERENTCFHMALYRLDGFHVEIKTRFTSGETWVGTITHDVLLVPYLDQISLSELL